MSSIQVRVIRVSLDGNWDYDKVQEAIDSVSLCNNIRTVIQVSAGLYRGPLYIPKTKNRITLASYNPERTIISWHNTATCINHHQVCSISLVSLYICLFQTCFLSSKLIFSTLFQLINLSGFPSDRHRNIWLWKRHHWRRGFHCWEYYLWELSPSGFVAISIFLKYECKVCFWIFFLLLCYVFAGFWPSVAVRVTADRCAFYNCRFLGWHVCVIWQSSYALFACKLLLQHLVSLSFCNKKSLPIVI